MDTSVWRGRSKMNDEHSCLVALVYKTCSTKHAVQCVNGYNLVYCSSPCRTDPSAPGDLKEAFDVCTLHGSVRTRKLVITIHTASHSFSLPGLLECMFLPSYRNIQMTWFPLSNQQCVNCMKNAANCL